MKSSDDSTLVQTYKIIKKKMKKQRKKKLSRHDSGDDEFDVHSTTSESESTGTSSPSDSAVDDLPTKSSGSEETDSNTDYGSFKAKVKKRLNAKKQGGKKHVTFNMKPSSYILEIEKLKNSCVLTKEEQIFLECVKFKHFMVDSLLLQKLTQLNNDLAQKLIFCTVLKEIPEEEEPIMEDPANKDKKEPSKEEEISNKIFDLLYTRLSPFDNRITDMFCYLLLQLNERTNFSINYKDILFMTNQHRHRRSHKKKTDKPIKKPSSQNETKSPTKNTIKNKTQKKEETNDKVKSDITAQEEEIEILNDFRNFLNAHGVNGVKTLGKLISSNICNILTGVVLENATPSGDLVLPSLSKNEVYFGQN